MLKQWALLSLFLALIASITLHIDTIPVWAFVLSLVVVVWRYSAFTGKLVLPGFWVKGILVTGGFVGVFLSYGPNISIEAMLTLLIAGVGLKPLEVQKKPDSYLLIFLCFLLQGMHFLFEDTPFQYFLVLLCCLLTLWSLIVVNLNEIGSRSSIVRSANYAIKLFFLSLPLTIFLFFVLPRLGPLWSLNISTKAGVVGFSESMSPGEVSELGRSSELAFRVTFEGEAPPKSERYWRALILDSFDGVKWSSRYDRSVGWGRKPVQQAKYTYEITAQPHDKKWLFSLANSSPISTGVGVSSTGTLVSRTNLIGVRKYKVSALDETGYQYGDLSEFLKTLYTKIPKGINKETQSLALELAGDSKDPSVLIEKFREYFFEQPFSYTLSPGSLESESRIDEFIFSTRKGFCAHYAGAVVYMLRSLGVPSRVVVGYLGGEKNDIANYYSVYQYDAHAWIEVWEEGVGWLRVDPTSWVSPERVEQGIEQAVSEEFVGFRSQSQWLRDIRAQVQALNFYWQDWMLSYKGDRQQQLLASIFGKRSPGELFLVIGAGFAICIGLIFVFIFVGLRGRKSQFKKIHDYWLSRLVKKGVKVSEHDTPSKLASKTIAYDKALELPVTQLITKLNQLAYQQSDHTLTSWEVLQIRRLIRRATR